MERYICIHAHFYQPPRENAWLEAVELQDSAYPSHDWNERVTAESYAPNSASRILDGDGRILQIVNNYSKISFNFGPTLLSWLKTMSSDTHRLIVEGDKESRERFAETLEILKRAWTEPSFSYQGKYYSFDNVKLTPKPFQKPWPEIRVAANSADTFPNIAKLGHAVLGLQGGRCPRCGADVGLDPEMRLGAARMDAEASNDFIEDAGFQNPTAAITEVIKIPNC